MTVPIIIVPRIPDVGNGSNMETIIGLTTAGTRLRSPAFKLQLQAPTPVSSRFLQSSQKISLSMTRQCHHEHHPPQTGFGQDSRDQPGAPPERDPVSLPRVWSALQVTLTYRSTLVGQVRGPAAPRIPRLLTVASKPQP